jgi:hypothetical protein
MSWFRTTFQQIPEARRHQQIQEFNETFSGPVGEHVLTAILTELYWFEEAANEEMMYCQNAAKRILRRMGAWDETEPGPVAMTRRLTSQRGSLLKRLLGRP